MWKLRAVWMKLSGFSCACSLVLCWCPSFLSSLEGTSVSGLNPDPGINHRTPDPDSLIRSLLKEVPGGGPALDGCVRYHLTLLGFSTVFYGLPLTHFLPTPSAALPPVKPSKVPVPWSLPRDKVWFCVDSWFFLQSERFVFISPARTNKRVFCVHSAPFPASATTTEGRICLDS